MPPTVIKCVLIINDSTGSGFEEVHYWNSDADNPDLLVRLNDLKNVIAPARADLLAKDCAIVGLRASYPREGAVASQPARVYFPGNQGQRGGSQEESLTMLWTDTTHTKTKATHLRGIWEFISYNGEYHPDEETGAAWTLRLNAYKLILVAGQYGWPSKDPALSARGTVTNYTIGVDGIITFTIAGPQNVRLPVGKVIEVSFSRINKSTSPLNDTLLVEVINATTLKTVQQYGAGPFATQGRYNWRATSFRKYADVISLAIGRRAQGRPFGLLPGRSRARRRY